MDIARVSFLVYWSSAPPTHTSLQSQLIKGHYDGISLSELLLSPDCLWHNHVYDLFLLVIYLGTFCLTINIFKHALFVIGSGSAIFGSYELSSRVPVIWVVNGDLPCFNNTEICHAYNTDSLMAPSSNILFPLFFINWNVKSVRQRKHWTSVYAYRENCV